MGVGVGVDQGHGSWQTHHEEDPPSPPVAFSHLVPHTVARSGQGILLKGQTLTFTSACLADSPESCSHTGMCVTVPECHEALSPSSASAGPSVSLRAVPEPENPPKPPGPPGSIAQ